MIPPPVVEAMMLVAHRLKSEDGRQILAELVKEMETGKFPTSQYDGLEPQAIADRVFDEVRHRVLAKRGTAGLAAHGLVAGEEFLMPDGLKAEYADFGSRLGAWLIDWAILFAGSFLVIMVTFGFGVFLLIIGFWLYYALQESSPHQATVGKRALGIITTTDRGERLSFGNATGRFFARLLTHLVPLLIGYLMMLWTEKKQTLHDMVAGTVVLKKGSESLPGSSSSAPASRPYIRNEFDG